MPPPKRPFVAQSDGRPEFVYSPLDPEKDCTRLVAIGPSTNVAAPLRCRLTHVNFSDRPRYEALSYMWGDETKRKLIFIDEKRFYVGKNLFDAIHFLRRSKSEGLFWIDAICINQGDVHEKNRQIRIMPHIYFRATTVLVWLGTKEITPELAQSTAGPLPSRYGSLSGQYSEQETARWLIPKLLCEDGYWKRLWVIQEIGKAAQIQVCYQTRQHVRNRSNNPGRRGSSLQSHDIFEDHKVDWDMFISTIRSADGLLSRLSRQSDPSFAASYTIDEVGPLRLDKQLRGKYRGSHSLRSLLEAHHHALCRNPRDKVYGLAGLADDCYGFPVDYEKSLFEVWSDTLSFLEDMEQTQSDLPGLALLMMNALGGPSELKPTTGPRSNIQLWLPFSLLGVVAYIGPTPTQCINNLVDADTWTASIRRNGRKGSDMEANERLVRRLLGVMNPELPCLGVFSLAEVSPSAVYRMKDDNQVATGLQKAPHYSHGDPPRCPKGESRLYQLLPPDWKSEGCSLGVVRGNLRAADLICRIPETGGMFVLRKAEQGAMYIQVKEESILSPCYHIVGAAMAWDDGHMPTSSWARLKRDSPDPVVSLCVETEILYSLLSPQMGETEESSYPDEVAED
ncbi:heterokaryon incompatibility protein-domain-containing protein [Podospora aff. communis PSN243]|uniref:Heterokaryon incompatibility protein-domain-containing protein n=1 Tax=Podospora aff. communis PSN243 TaxID=3040156 RepID=A0AAV9G8L3_9PEZI|nr:heterokaryon incompatibility protein-domain-containing protein [Podospora aff. communis PSN243]